MQHLVFKQENGNPSYYRGDLFGEVLFSADRAMAKPFHSAAAAAEVARRLGLMHAPLAKVQTKASKATVS